MVLNTVFNVNMAILNRSIELRCDCFGCKHFGLKRLSYLNLFFFLLHKELLRSLWSRCKSTVPCWLLFLASLLTGCELPAMSACVSREAAVSRAKMQE